MYKRQGELNIVKQGEVLNGFKDDFTYQKENLEGAVFEVYAAEDIYTADFQKEMCIRDSLIPAKSQMRSV